MIRKITIITGPRETDRQKLLKKIMHNNGYDQKTLLAMILQPRKLKTVTNNMAAYGKTLNTLVIDSDKCITFNEFSKLNLLAEEGIKIYVMCDEVPSPDVQQFIDIWDTSEGIYEYIKQIEPNKWEGKNDLGQFVCESYRQIKTFMVQCAAYKRSNQHFMNLTVC